MSILEEIVKEVRQPKAIAAYLMAIQAAREAKASDQVTAQSTAQKFNLRRGVVMRRSRHIGNKRFKGV